MQLLYVSVCTFHKESQTDEPERVLLAIGGGEERHTDRLPLHAVELGHGNGRAAAIQYSSLVSWQRTIEFGWMCN